MEKREIKPELLEREKHFNRYLEDFDLTIENLRDRAILDVGSGMIPDFVEYCLENKITNKIYAVDHWPFGQEFIFKPKDDSMSHEDDWERQPFVGADDLKSKKHYIQAEGGNIPIVKEYKFDLILLRAALGQEGDISKLINDMVSYLKPGEN